MSLENLINATNALNDIGAKVDNFLPTLRVDADAIIADIHAAAATTMFVDQAVGDDANSGTLGSPIASIQEASTRALAGGILKIRLLSDYTVPGVIDIQQSAVDIAPATGYAQKTLDFANQIDGVDERSPRFSPVFNSTTFRFGDMKIVLGVTAAHVTQKFVFSSYALTSFLFQTSTLEVLAGADQVLAQKLGGVGIAAQNITVIGDMGGHWIDQIASGALPQNTAVCAYSNIATL